MNKKNIKYFVFILITIIVLYSDKFGDDYLKYRGGGNLANTEKLMSMLLAGESVDKVEIKSEGESYGIVVNYVFSDMHSNYYNMRIDVFEKAMLRNAVVIFYLDYFADYVTFKAEGGFSAEYTFYREDIVPRFEGTYKNFNRNKFIRAFLKDEEYDVMKEILK